LRVELPDDNQNRAGSSRWRTWPRARDDDRFSDRLFDSQND